MINCLIFLSSVALITVAGQDPVVETLAGKVKGSVFTVPGVTQQGMSFRGIPYAAPPTGSRRFQPPAARDPWTGEYDATEFGPMCPQPPSVFLGLAQLIWKVDISQEPPLPISEDCLTLDVYTANLTDSRPVMVFIHGGGFRLGASRFYNGKYLAVGKKVVIVMIQYRLGALGFFATADGTIKGNMALKDQVAALKWVKDNIAKFGGNPENVTIYGQNVGAFFVSLHLVSPMSRGLFHNAIMQSGSYIGSNFFAPPRDLVGDSRHMADMIGCQHATDDLVSCLQSLNQSAFWQPPYPGGNLPIIISATVDGEFLTDTPKNLLMQGNYNKDVNVMAGCMEFEGYILSLSINATITEPRVENSPFASNLATNLMQFYVAPNMPQKWQSLMKVILKEYATDLTENIQSKEVAEMVGDITITVNTFTTMKLLAERFTGHMFFYEFQQRPSLSKRPDYITADHLDDTLFMGIASTGSAMNIAFNFTEDDRKMDEIMMNYWTKFAESGDPNGNQQPTWPSFRDMEKYMALKVMPEAKTGYKIRKMKFWTEIIPELLMDKDSATKPDFTLAVAVVMATIHVYLA